MVHASLPPDGRAARPRSVVFYLPQFHPIPENDEWWGPGFTEWVNVAAARPRFAGHDQPHIPADLGFYDLRTEQARDAQAELARRHGVDAFCYYHYWFNGRRLLEQPFTEVLRSGRPDFEFCLCWANEPWTRSWDGASSTVLVEQRYSEQDDVDHIRSLLPAFADPRYVRVDGRPLFLVYRSTHLPDPQRTTDTWRRECVAAGLPEPYLCAVQSFVEERTDPRARGFDAAVDFQPDWRGIRQAAPRRAARRLLPGRLHDRAGSAEVLRVPYEQVMRRALDEREEGYRRFPCVMPSWDNSPRRARGAVVIEGSTPQLYEQWLRAIASQRPELLFVNAWNEWGEGCHLEPSRRWGRAYLEAHARVMAEVRGA
jgi:lipopolysaccharide biosynthesis protein